MRVGWLADKSDYIGGAELTQAEFRAAAPEGVEVVDCPPGGVVDGLDRYVVHNHTSYSLSDLTTRGWAPGKVIRYYHDVRAQVVVPDLSICCSPLQADYMGLDDCAHIPPPINLSSFQAEKLDNPDGACWIGSFHNNGKGVQLAVEWAEANDQPIDFYGAGPFAPSESPYARVHNAVRHSEVPALLARYKTFVHLPTAIEPFGRSVVEAWAARCELVINGNVGARYWIEERPEALETAAEDFWGVVCG